jgi:hypothetical protein
MVPVVPINLNLDLRIFSPGDDGDVTQVIDMPQLPGMPGGGGAPTSMDGLDLGLDWTWNWNWVWECGGASAAGMDWSWNWTWDDACLPQELRGELPDGARLDEDRLGGLLEALRPEGTSLAEAVGGVDDPRGAEAPTQSEPPAKPQRTKRDDRGSKAPKSDRAQPPFAPGPPPTDDGGRTALMPSSSGDEGSRMAAAAPAGGVAGRLPARDPADASPEPLALAAGLAPVATGGGGGGGLVLLLVAALVGALALLPPLAGGRVHAVQRKLSSLLSSSRLERPG